MSVRTRTNIKEVAECFFNNLAVCFWGKKKKNIQYPSLYTITPNHISHATLAWVFLFTVTAYCYVLTGCRRPHDYWLKETHRKKKKRAPPHQLQQYPTSSSLQEALMHHTTCPKQPIPAVFSYFLTMQCNAWHHENRPRTSTDRSPLPGQ